jgi:hypothetical protein
VRTDYRIYVGSVLRYLTRDGIVQDFGRNVNIYIKSRREALDILKSKYHTVFLLKSDDNYYTEERYQCYERRR